MRCRSLKLKKALSPLPGADLTPFTFRPWLPDLLEAFAPVRVLLSHPGMQRLLLLIYLLLLAWTVVPDLSTAMVNCPSCDELAP